MNFKDKFKELLNSLQLQQTENGCLAESFSLKRRIKPLFDRKNITTQKNRF
jgi:hypothetical protein